MKLVKKTKLITHQTYTQRNINILSGYKTNK